MMRNIGLLVVTAFSFFIVQPAWGHSIWLEEEGEQLTLMYGHVGGESEGYEPSKVEEVTALDGEGNPVVIEMLSESELVTFDPEGEAALVAVSFDNGFWVETADGWQNVSKREVEDYISASHTFKYTKALYDWSDTFMEPVGLTLEIVPLTNPFDVALGEDLEVQVLYNGEPASNIEITHDESILQTDENGMATVTLTQPGLQYLEASLSMLVENNPDTDEISHSSTLTFELPSEY